MSLPRLTRSRMCPSEASTAYWRPRNFLSVRVLAGLSTISRFLATVPLNAFEAARNFKLSYPGRPAGDSTTRPRTPQAAALQSPRSRFPQPVRRPGKTLHPSGELELEESAQRLVDRHAGALGDLLRRPFDAHH